MLTVLFDTILPQQIRRANFVIIGTADYQHSLVDTNDSCIHCVEGKCVIVLGDSLRVSFQLESDAGPAVKNLTTLLVDQLQPTAGLFRLHTSPTSTTTAHLRCYSVHCLIVSGEADVYDILHC